MAFGRFVDYGPEVAVILLEVALILGQKLIEVMKQQRGSFRRGNCA